MKKTEEKRGKRSNTKHKPNSGDRCSFSYRGLQHQEEEGQHLGEDEEEEKKNKHDENGGGDEDLHTK